MSLPRPVTTTDFYLQAILAVLDRMESLMLARVEDETVEIEISLTPDQGPPVPAEPEPAAPAPAAGAPSPLPANFPGRGPLLAAGIEHVEDVPDAAGLAAIKGLNRATIKRIEERLGR